MASAAIPGRLAYLRASTAAASTATTSQTQITELKNYVLTVAANEIDVTSHDSSGWKETLTGTRSWSWTADLVYLSTGPMQGALRANLLGATPALLNISFKQSTSNSAKKYQGKTRLTGFELSHEQDSEVLGKLSGVGSGILVRTA